ncbi:enolase C-terminal domain-like protein (plasmid) [Paraburkholderia sp. PREW-6R]|uniref:enolase C-terminal domain-like protein n=1 Tax=Paraburkholderia sp. PREW-6R TaxID=3141544 RepID=UPI0031F51A8D
MMSKISKVDIFDFEYEVQNLAATTENTHNHVAYRKGGRMKLSKYAIVLETDDGARGEYVAMWGGTRPALAQSIMLAPDLLGRDPSMREEIYDEFKRKLHHFDHMGHGPVDIALWDLAGKQLNASISTMLGSYRTRLKAYASTFHGDRAGGLDSPQAYGEFAVRCREMGYRGYKIHGWFDGNPREEAAAILATRKAVGNEMDLMYDGACDLKTFADALYVGRACDEANYFWFEDPYRDAGLSAFSHKKLREMLKTPFLIGEHVRSLEPKADFIMAGGTDFVRVDPEYDMGITGAIKTAHLAEAFGLDVEVHAVGPAHRHVMGAIRNSNYYEVALVGPDCANNIPTVYACDYNDQIDCIDSNGTVPVPTGPGLGVTYDWDYIRHHTKQHHVFELNKR